MENKDAAIAANFERILLILDCLGPAYEPRQDAVSITTLEEKLEEACAVFCEYDDARREEAARCREFEDAVTAFADLIPAIRQMADVTFDHEIFARDVDTIIGRFNSQVAVVGAPHEPFTGRTVEQRIRDSRIACVADLLAMLRFRSRPDIAASDVTIAEIDARLSLLRFRSDSARAAEQSRAAAARARQRILDELPKIVAQIKSELANQPGRDSAAYHQVNVLAARRF